MDEETRTDRVKAAVLSLMRLNKIVGVCISYSGSGDEGYIREAQADIEGPPAWFDFDAVRITVANPDTGEVELEASFEDCLCDLADELLNSHSIDYCNGDGGQGSVDIDVKAGTFTINHQHQVWVSMDPILA